jgi:hypothetical protein
MRRRTHDAPAARDGIRLVALLEAADRLTDNREPMNLARYALRKLRENLS